jgi:hypothetical protein
MDDGILGTHLELGARRADQALVFAPLVLWYLKLARFSR